MTHLLILVLVKYCALIITLLVISAAYMMLSKKIQRLKNKSGKLPDNITQLEKIRTLAGYSILITGLVNVTLVCGALFAFPFQVWVMTALNGALLLCSIKLLALLVQSRRRLQKR